MLDNWLKLAAGNDQDVELGEVWGDVGVGCVGFDDYAVGGFDGRGGGDEDALEGFGFCFLMSAPSFIITLRLMLRSDVMVRGGGEVGLRWWVTAGERGTVTYSHPPAWPCQAPLSLIHI